MNQEIKVLHEILFANDGLYQYNEELAEKIADVLSEYVMSKDKKYMKDFCEYELQV